jgi:hypothetical protein
MLMENSNPINWIDIKRKLERMRDIPQKFFFFNNETIPANIAIDEDELVEEQFQADSPVANNVYVNANIALKHDKSDASFGTEYNSEPIYVILDDNHESIDQIYNTYVNDGEWNPDHGTEAFLLWLCSSISDWMAKNQDILSSYSFNKHN